jgi:hypothetical protein
MNWAIPTEKTVKPAAGLLAALLAYAVLRTVGFYNFIAPEAEGLNVLIQLIGAIYAVLLAFTIFVIWGQFTEVENCVMRECNSLDDVLRFCNYLNTNARAEIRKAMATYTHQVLRYEWQALGDGRKDQHAEEFFTHFVNTVVGTTTKGESELFIYARMFDVAQKASDHRDERVAKSLTRIPPTLASLVNTIAGVLLLLIFVYPFHHWVTGVSCFILVAVVLFLSDFVISDTDNPLKGAWNVSSQPFSDLKL